MNNKFLLYIDILGFSDLVAEDARRVDDLYEVIASLNAHKHDAFRCVIFSDTILVYNVDGGENPRDIEYLIMFLCEFAKDLLHRLTKRGIVFRAVISNGYFRHYQLNEVPCFYGSALVKAYEAEKEIKAIGLFIENSLLEYCDIFHTSRFNSGFSYVYITQALNEIEPLCAPCKAPDIGHYLEQTFLTWMGGPELLHVRDIILGSGSDQPKSVLAKYVNTLHILRKKYPRIIACLQANSLDVRAVAPDADWDSVIARHPADYKFAIETVQEF